MNLEDYSVRMNYDEFVVVHNPSEEWVNNAPLPAPAVSFDTLLRIAVADHAKRNKIRL